MIVRHQKIIMIYYVGIISLFSKGRKFIKDYKHWERSSFAYK